MMLVVWCPKIFYFQVVVFFIFLSVKYISELLARYYPHRLPVSIQRDVVFTFCGHQLGNGTAWIAETCRPCWFLQMRIESIILFYIDQNECKSCLWCLFICFKWTIFHLGLQLMLALIPCNKKFLGLKPSLGTFCMEFKCMGCFWVLWLYLPMCMAVLETYQHRDTPHKQLNVMPFKCVSLHSGNLPCLSVQRRSNIA